MSAVISRMPLARAQQLAAAIRAELAPGCARIEIAGSVRRHAADVGDIEIVAIPAERTKLEIGQPADLLSPILTRLEREGQFVRLKPGGPRYDAGKYFQFELPKHGSLGNPVQLDLFLANPETWGCIFTIRTGPADFSRRLVTKQCLGGLCPDRLAFRGGRLVIVHGGLPVPTSEERDLFHALSIPYLEPWERR